VIETAIGRAWLKDETRVACMEESMIMQERRSESEAKRMGKRVRIFDDQRFGKIKDGILCEQ
jgi:hypothetical protein